MYWVLFSTITNALMANGIFHKIFWHLKITHYSSLSVFLGQSGQFTSLDVHIIPLGFVVSLVKNLFLGLTPENCLKIWHFPQSFEQSPPVCWSGVCWKPSYLYIYLYHRAITICAFLVMRIIALWQLVRLHAPDIQEARIFKLQTRATSIINI